MLAFIMTIAVMSGVTGKVHLSDEMIASAESPKVILTGENEEPAFLDLSSQDFYASTSAPQLQKVAVGGEEEEAAEEEDREPTDEELIRAAMLSTMDEKSKAKLIAREEQETAEKAEAEKKKQEKEKAKEEQKKNSGFVYSQHIPLSYELQEFTFNKCKERGLEYELVLAIMWRESRFKINAVNYNSNGTCDNGIMQINDVNRKWLREKYGITDLMDPYQNINAGTAMLGELTQKYGPHNALMAYQYGEGGMQAQFKKGNTTSHAIQEAYRQRDYYRTII